MSTVGPEIQVISTIVIAGEDGKILFVKNSPDDDRWWLPGDDLVPYQHPDDRAGETLNAIPGLSWEDLRMLDVESFRGRRGWHIMFNYYARAAVTPADTDTAAWFSVDNFPRTMHGQYERETVRTILERAGASSIS